MTVLLCLYSGPSMKDLDLCAATVDERIIRDFTMRIVAGDEDEDEYEEDLESLLEHRPGDQ